MAPVLIIIDLQNDYISPGGPLKDKYIRAEGIISNLQAICPRFAGNIIFVKTEYFPATWYKTHPPRRDEGFRYPVSGSDLDGNDPDWIVTHLDGAHKGKRKFCEPGSSGAEFPSAVSALEAKFAAKTFTKHWYSSFTETGLHTWLEERGIGDGPLFFAGVTANNCVLASLTDAFFLGYRVRVLRDCVGSTSPSLGDHAFSTIDRYYGQDEPV